MGGRAVKPDIHLVSQRDLCPVHESIPNVKENILSTSSESYRYTFSNSKTK